MASVEENVKKLIEVSREVWYTGYAIDAIFASPCQAVYKKEWLNSARDVFDDDLLFVSLEVNNLCANASNNKVSVWVNIAKESRDSLGHEEINHSETVQTAIFGVSESSSIKKGVKEQLERANKIYSKVSDDLDDLVTNYNNNSARRGKKKKLLKRIKSMDVEAIEGMLKLYDES